MSPHETSTHETSTAAPEGLLEALDAYEAALAANDLDALDAAFVDAPGTMRGDDRGLLVGHDAISAFRGARGGVQARSLTRVEVRPLAEGLALVVSVSAFAAGGQGLQTQLWRRDSNSNSDHGDAGPRWRIEAAHVTGRPKAFDTTVWRAVGDPLVAPTASGPLDGLTVAVKDLYAVPGQPVGAGNPTYLRESPVQTTPAAAVAALLDAGAAIRGIARTDEFAYNLTGRNEHHGTPPNGAVPTRLPGGSSSGSASAVRLGTAEIGIGTDTAGSVRVPASYQGLWGLRTTHGAVSREGLLPLAPSFDTVGWLTRSADVLLAALDATVPSDPVAPAEPELFVPAELLDLVEPAVAEAFAAFVAGHGHPIGTVRLADLGIPPLDDLRELLRLVQAAEAVAAHGAWIDAHPGGLSAVVGDRFAAARANDPAATADAVARLDGVRATIRTALAGRTLLFPTVPGPAPLIAADTAALERTRTATTAMTSLASVGGLPAVSAPALTVDGAPVGVCLVGEPGTDRALVIRAGRMLQH
ncbi:Asp-tRNA(Asn)/Glu-tRNA(Gln) amidotransferase A subunit family amidase [Curtobacterium sp. PhB137]|uniref:AtzH-like domain-containing protein n=1 Tax=unclassified Curtobacterium TaxID=257496 RepID=UPI000F507FEB|nr:AtzH-like domain-containing protein [Curtobacterium sp. PhB137]RPE83159.1 Asp-tRNA(Asn)/Glu-tRNA(Gln) amidotransferase A subunit family amidase [Curtobacterium sp. PhB137]